MNTGKNSTAPPLLNWYGRIAGFCFSHAGNVIVLYLLAATCSLFLAFNYLSFDTDPGKMISEKLPFRKDFLIFKQAFPIVDNAFLLIIEAESPQDAKKAGQTLVRFFKKQPHLFTDVYAPGLGDFFERHGLLFLTENQLVAMSTKLQDNQSFLELIAKHPDLSSLSDLVNTASTAAKSGRTIQNFGRLLTLVDGTMRAWLKNHSAPLNWSELIFGTFPEDVRLYITVKPVIDFTRLDPVAKPLAAANTIINKVITKQKGRVMISLTGEAALNSQELGTVMRGTLKAGIISFILVAMIIWFAMPATRLVLPALSLLLLGSLLNIGFAALTIGSLNMISIVFVVLFIGLGIDYAVHIILRYWEKLVQGQGRRQAIISACEKTGPALALCTLTTSLAFLAFVFTDFVGMAQLGIIAAGGITVAFIAAITLIPAILALVPMPGNPPEGGAENSQGQESVYAAWWRHTRPLLTIGTFCVALAVLFFLPNARFDGDPIHLKDPKSSTVMAYQRVVSHEQGEVYAAQVISADADTAAKTAQRLQQLDAVKTVRWLGSFIPERQKAKMALLRLIKKMTYRSVNLQDTISEPEQRTALIRLQQNLDRLGQSVHRSERLDLIIQRLRRTLSLVIRKIDAGAELSSLKHDLFSTLPEFMRKLTLMSTVKPISSDNMDEEITRRYKTADGRWRLEIIPKKEIVKQGNLETFVAQVRSIAPHATGAPVEIVGAAKVVSSAMIKATIIALFFVLLVLALFYKSIVDVILVVLPLVLAGLLLVGYTVCFHEPFNFANVLVLPLLLGLGIDSAIHYVSRARVNRNHINIMATTTPRAIILSALTTIGSFGTLWLSSHKGISSMGELLVISLCITLWCTLVVLPQLITWVWADRSPGGKKNTTYKISFHGNTQGEKKHDQ